MRNLLPQIPATRPGLEGLKIGHYGTILADVPQRFQTYDNKPAVVARASGSEPERIHYTTMTTAEIAALPVAGIAAKDCVLIYWTSPPFLTIALDVIAAWGFTYKSFGFAWMKGDPNAVPTVPAIGMGYWTRSNIEFALLATRGKPKRLNADVRQAILEPRREHSRKPDIHDRIERLCAGPRVELFARQTRPGWDSWGDQIHQFNSTKGDD